MGDSPEAAVELGILIFRNSIFHSPVATLMEFKRKSSIFHIVTNKMLFIKLRTCLLQYYVISKLNCILENRLLKCLFVVSHFC